MKTYFHIFFALVFSANIIHAAVEIRNPNRIAGGSYHNSDLAISAFATDGCGIVTARAGSSATYEGIKAFDNNN